MSQKKTLNLKLGIAKLTESKLEMLKRCATCKEEKPRKEFYINRAKPDGRQYSCKVCQRRYHNDTWYESHRKHRIQQVKERKARVTRENYRKIFMEYFIHGCVDCGENDHRLLEFDHVKGIKKRGRIRPTEGVGSLVRAGYKWETIEKEIQKCKIRCRNCHHLKTHKQFDYMKNIKDIVEEYNNKREQISKRCVT